MFSCFKQFGYANNTHRIIFVVFMTYSRVYVGIIVSRPINFHSRKLGIITHNVFIQLAADFQCVSLLLFKKFTGFVLVLLCAVLKGSFRSLTEYG